MAVTTIFAFVLLYKVMYIIMHKFAFVAQGIEQPPPKR